MSKIAKIVDKHGAENLIIRTTASPIDTVIGPIAVSTLSRTVEADRRITVRRYNPVDDYKIELDAVVTDAGDKLGFQAFYTSDLDGLWRENRVKVFALDNGTRTQLSFNTCL